MKVALISPPWKIFSPTPEVFLLNFAKGVFISQEYAPKIVRKIKKAASYPLSLISVATSLLERRKNDEVRIFDAEIEGQLMKKLRKFSPELVGITTFTSPSLLWVYKLIENVKNQLGAIIILGGPHVTLDPINSLKSCKADFIIRGDGEIVFPQLLNFLDGKSRHIPKKGVAFRRENNIVATPPFVADLSLLPIPNRDLYPPDKMGYQELNLETSRGCIFNCDFCYYSSIPSFHPWRSKPLFVIQKEIEELQKYGIKRVFIVDNNFGIHKKRAIKVSKILSENGMEWYAPIDVSHLDEKVIKSFSRHNCLNLYIGVETGYIKYTKIPSFSFLFSVIKGLMKNGITPITSYVLGRPGETRGEIFKTLKVAFKIHKLSLKYRKKREVSAMFDPCLFRPYPGTILSKRLEESGIVLPKTVVGWGRLINDILTLRMERVNFTKNVTKKDMIRVLFAFAKMNLKDFIIPRIEEEIWKS